MNEGPRPRETIPSKGTTEVLPLDKDLVSLELSVKLAGTTSMVPGRAPTGSRAVKVVYHISPWVGPSPYPGSLVNSPHISVISVCVSSSELQGIFSEGQVMGEMYIPQEAIRTICIHACVTNGSACSLLTACCSELIS